LEDLLLLRLGLHFVRTQKWHGSRYVKLKVRSVNLVLILDILLVWLGYAFYRTGGSSWIFGCDFIERDEDTLGAT
jgi:hypothetical protein